MIAGFQGRGVLCCGVGSRTRVEFASRPPFRWQFRISPCTSKQIARHWNWKDNQVRHHGSHGHGHSHHGHGHSHHGHALIDRHTAQGTRVTVAGLGLNLGLTAAKGVGGVLWHSSSLLAEAVHSLSDLLSDFVTLFTYKKARKPPNEKFPYGYSKLEPMGSVIVSSLLVSAGFAIAIHSYDALSLLWNQMSEAANVTDGAAPSHSMNPAALYIMLASVVSKEAMFQWTMRVAKRVNSDVLVANAWHHRTDAASSLVALAGVAGAVYGYGWVDPVGGILVSGMVIKAGIDSGMPSVLELLDTAAPKHAQDKVNVAIAMFQSTCADVARVEDLRIRKSGPSYYADMVFVPRDRNMTVEELDVVSGHPMFRADSHQAQGRHSSRST
ncbi:cation efflux family-domain-containing protein [Gaertneriomyces semiglobifer]|nr:cation efflux family-domain-containing protein [Gaertneriomyces semiglobifer]